MECLCEISRSFSASFRGVSLQNFAEKLSAKNIFFAQGVCRGETRKKELFSWADLNHTYSEKSGTHVIRALMWRPSWILKWPPSIFNLSHILASVRHRDMI